MKLLPCYSRPALRLCICLIFSVKLFATPSPNSSQGDECRKGKEIYLAKCSQCHGENGDGKGVGADFFKPRPRDFTSGAFKIRTTESGELPTNADLTSIIRKGMPYTGMPAWPRFSDDEVSNLVCYVKSFSADFSDTSIHAKTIAIPKPPAFSLESAEKGKALYKENKCMDCHGALGRGDGESGPTLKDDWGNAIRPADLTRRWTFRGGARREDIYRTFTTGLNGTPMPSFSSSITEDDRWHLVDYVHSLSPGDEPGYASMVTADSITGKLDLEKGNELFKNCKPALFPVVGQVIEGERNFFPASNAIGVRAVYDDSNIAILLSWHDMNPQKSGSNSPLEIPTSTENYSDAVAIQIPFKQGEGNAKPYFLFGDKKTPAEIWFADLAGTSSKVFIGKGRSALTDLETTVLIKSTYADGEWSVIMMRSKKPAKGLAMSGGTFMPISFSLWDGLSEETGVKRGVTAWYTLYLKPPTQGLPILPAVGKAVALLAIQAMVIFWVRRSRRNSKANSGFQPRHISKKNFD